MPPRIEKKNLAAKNLTRQSRENEKQDSTAEAQSTQSFILKLPPPRPQRLGGEPSNSYDMVFIYVNYFLLLFLFARDRVQHLVPPLQIFFVLLRSQPVFRAPLFKPIVFGAAAVIIFFQDLLARRA